MDREQEKCCKNKIVEEVRESCFIWKCSIEVLWASGVFLKPDKSTWLFEQYTNGCYWSLNAMQLHIGHLLGSIKCITNHFRWRFWSSSCEFCGKPIVWCIFFKVLTKMELLYYCIKSLLSLLVQLLMIISPQMLTHSLRSNR